MAFLNNNCKYPNCNRIYSNLHDLIVHIELEHIDFNCERLQHLDDERIDSLPLSYILKYNNNDKLPPPIFLNITNNNNDTNYINNNKNNNSINEHSYSSNEPVIIDAFDLNDFSKLADDNLVFEELISPIKSEKLTRINNNNKEKKPFVCNMPGCHKSYKNKNGIKYHCKNYHKCNTPIIVTTGTINYTTTSTTTTPTTTQSLLKFNQLLKITRDQPKVKVESIDLLDDFNFTNLTTLEKFKNNNNKNNNGDMIYTNYQQRYDLITTSTVDNNQVPLNQSFNYQIDDDFPSI